MRLTLQSQLMEDVVVIRCQGRIVAGDEVEAFQAELEKQAKILLLPSDFSTAEAGQAGVDLVKRVQSLLPA